MEAASRGVSAVLGPSPAQAEGDDDAHGGLSSGATPAGDGVGAVGAPEPAGTQDRLRGQAAYATVEQTFSKAAHALEQLSELRAREAETGGALQEAREAKAKADAALVAANDAGVVGDVLKARAKAEAAAEAVDAAAVAADRCSALRAPLHTVLNESYSAFDRLDRELTDSASTSFIKSDERRALLQQEIRCRVLQLQNLDLSAKVRAAAVRPAPAAAPALPPEPVDGGRQRVRGLARRRPAADSRVAHAPLATRTFPQVDPGLGAVTPLWQVVRAQARVLREHGLETDALQAQVEEAVKRLEGEGLLVPGEDAGASVALAATKVGAEGAGEDKMEASIPSPAVRRSIGARGGDAALPASKLSSTPRLSPSSPGKLFSPTVTVRPGRAQRLASGAYTKSVRVTQPQESAPGQRARGVDEADPAKSGAAPNPPVRHRVPPGPAPRKPAGETAETEAERPTSAASAAPSGREPFVPTYAQMAADRGRVGRAAEVPAGQARRVPGTGPAASRPATAGGASSVFSRLFQASSASALAKQHPARAGIAAADSGVRGVLQEANRQHRQVAFGGGFVRQGAEGRKARATMPAGARRPKLLPTAPSTSATISEVAEP